MLKIKKIRTLILCGVALISMGVGSLTDDWNIVFDSFKEQVLNPSAGQSLYRGKVTVNEDLKLRFHAGAVNDEIIGLIISDSEGETLEPQLEYDSYDKAFSYGKRKNKISRVVKSDSTNKEVIRSGIEIWLELRDK